MKKFISGFLAGAIVFGSMGVFAASYVANPAGFKVFVNGKEFKSDPVVLEVNGSTYLPLRAMGEALGVPVKWNAELGQAEVGTTPTESKSYSRTNPAPINEVQTIAKEYFDVNTNVSVRVMETIRGNEAWEKVKAENQFNNPAPDGYEYILAKIAFSVLDISNDTAVSVSGWDFKSFSGKNEEIKVGPSTICPKPELEGKLFAGGSTEGYVVFTVKKDDANPKIVYGMEYDGSGGIWFSLK